jgi:hypothetical protein
MEMRMKGDSLSAAAGGQICSKGAVKLLSGLHPPHRYFHIIPVAEGKNVHQNKKNIRDFEKAREFESCSQIPAHFFLIVHNK